MRTRFELTLYGSWMLGLAVAFYAFPAWHLVLWSSLASSCAVAIVRGITTHRPARPSAWWLLAAAVTVFAAGDTTYNVLTTLLGQDNPFPSLADVFYLAMYPLAAVGLLQLVRRRSGGQNRGALLDALSLTTALALLSWIFLVDPYVRDTQLTLLERATSIAYPLGDVVILATLARLLITSARNPAAALLGVGTAGLLVSDVLYGFVQLGGSWQIGSAYDLGWVIFYVAWGAAALHSSMPSLTVPLRGPSDEMSFRRIALLVGVSLVAPGVLLADSLSGDVDFGPIIAASSALLFLLVLVRLSGVVERHRQAVERERMLRSAGAALVSAAVVEDVAASVRATVARLVPRGSPHIAVLVIDAGTAALPPGESSPGNSRLVRRDALSAADIDGVEGFPITLMCPLVPVDRPTTEPQVGLLVVGADEALLLTLQGALEVLASLAALAVERVTLSKEVRERENEAYFRTLVQNTHDVILITDDGGRVRYASPSSRGVLGSDVVGTRLIDLVDPGDRDTAARALAQQGSSVDASPIDLGILRGDGERVDVEVTSRDLRGDPTVRGVVLTLRNVTQQRRLQNDLAYRAFHDPLTGLPNRVLFQERVGRALALSRDDERVVGVLLIDLDEFKLVNDTMGHGAGDELLIAVAARLTGILQACDTAARLGGDEFAVLVEGAATAAEVERIADRVVGALSAPLDLAGGMTTSASVGVTTTPDAQSTAEMLSQADLALYAAKAAGKGRWRRYQPALRLAALDRLDVRTELEQALAAGAFELRYQPIVELGGGEIVGVEALLRWQHPRRGAVPPAEFIPVAEETGLIVPLGAWVLHRALQDLARWRRESALARRLTLSVNVSAHQVRAPGFRDTMIDALARWDVSAQWLTLEITETALLAESDEVSADLIELRSLGLRIAIDDFGTGYSSLEYLRLHPVDVLKVDRSFTHGIEDSRRQAALVGTIVHLARALDLRVVAEGVETTAQRDALMLSGCDLGQGYLFSVPVPADTVALWLRAGTDRVPDGRAAGSALRAGDELHPMSRGSP